jgi:DNA invertase Pin-like site-specific DNA recombinase
MAGVGDRLEVEGISKDARIGEFEGQVRAAAVSWEREPTLRYLVSDERKPRPFWVSMSEIERLARAPARSSEAEAEQDEDEDASAPEHPGEEADEAPAPIREEGRALGYASVPPDEPLDGDMLRAQAEAIDRVCEERGLELVELVRDIEPQAGSDLRRPGLAYALGQITEGKASCLVITALDKLARSAGDIGTLVEWFEENGARLVAVHLDLDTDTPEGRTVARALVSVGALDRRKVAERTRKGLKAARAKGGATGRPAVSDKPALRRRIAAMREEGMTLQAIADALNAEGVPTLRGGAQWRPSSVQAATGYKRPRRNRALRELPSSASENGADETRSQGR